MPEVYPDSAGFKRLGTSEKAAKLVKASDLRVKVLAILNEHPMTADQAAKALGESVLSIRPRFSELLAKALIKDTGLTAKNESGRSAVIWALVC